MSQFRNTGLYYVSKWGGNSANPGTDVSPFSHPADYGTSSHLNTGIVGSGYYNGFWTGSRRIVGDGKVIFDFLGAAIGINQMENIHLKNFDTISGLSSNHLYIDCIFENFNNIFARGNYRRNVVLNTINGTYSNTLGIGWFNNLLIGGWTGLGIGKEFEYNFIPKDKILSIDSATQSLYTNNMVNGLINLSGNLYESKKLFDGSARPDADPLVADVVSVFPNFYTQGNFSGDPKFIDVISRTVDPTSDLLRKSNAFGFIGGVKPGKYITFQNSDFVITTQNIDTSNPDLLRIETGFDFGKIRITGKVSDTLISSQAVDIRIPFFFDSSVIGGDPLNNNVPDSVHGLRGIDTLGDLPYRLRFEVRSSQMPNASRFNNDEWDNDISGIAGRWYLMEYGQPMLHHLVASVAYGNADKFAINAPIKVPFNYRSLDIEITLSNNRSQV